MFHRDHGADIDESICAWFCEQDNVKNARGEEFISEKRSCISKSVIERHSSFLAEWIRCAHVNV